MLIYILVLSCCLDIRLLQFLQIFLDIFLLFQLAHHFHLIISLMQNVLHHQSQLCFFLFFFLKILLQILKLILLVFLLLRTCLLCLHLLVLSQIAIFYLIPFSIFLLRHLLLLWQFLLLLFLLIYPLSMNWILVFHKLYRLCSRYLNLLLKVLVFLCLHLVIANFYVILDIFLSFFFLHQVLLCCLLLFLLPVLVEFLPKLFLKSLVLYFLSWTFLFFLLAIFLRMGYFVCICILL